MVTPSPHVNYDRDLFSVSLILQFVLSTLGILTNGSILLCLFLRPNIRTQPNFVVANLSCADLLMCTTYIVLAWTNIANRMEPPSIHACIYSMAPNLFAFNLSLCCSVAAVHHRSTCCLLGYRSIHGVRVIVEESWKLRAASVSVWCLTALGACAVFIDAGSDGALAICIYPVALQNSYLVPYAMFVCCVGGVVILEHVRVLCLLSYALVKKPSSERPDARIVRSTSVLLIAFFACWAPFYYVSYLYLHPGAAVYQDAYYIQAQWLSTMPLVHASLIDPFAHALCEREYLETLSGILASACCRCCQLDDLRWRLKWRLRRGLFDRSSRRRRRRSASKSPRTAFGDQPPPFAIEMRHVALEFPVVVAVEEVGRGDGGGGQSSNGHLNLAYHSEYM